MIYMLNIQIRTAKSASYLGNAGPYEHAQFKNGDIISDFIARSRLPDLTNKSSLSEAMSFRENVTPSTDTMLMIGFMRKILGWEDSKIRTYLISASQDFDAQPRTRLLTASEISVIHATYRPLFRKVQKRFRSGVDQDFFYDWGDDAEPLPLSPLRQSYDHYMARLLIE